MPRTTVFVDLDQCSKEAARLNPLNCRILAYCGRGFNGPIPLCVLMRSPSLSREAADSLFQYDLGKRVQSGDIAPGDRVVIVSKDASWYNADPHLRADGVDDVIICSNEHDLPRDLVTESRAIERAGMPKSEKAVNNFIMNNVAPHARDDFLSTSQRSCVCSECGESMASHTPPVEFGSMERKTLPLAHSREVQITERGKESVQVGDDNF
eukprot:jgi/Mesvir1/16621/Mv10155-RA.1